jgi:reverse gyrase
MATVTGGVTIDFYGNAIDNMAKAEALQEIANNDLDILLKLQQLSKSKKAIEKFKNNWVFIKNMFI